MSEHGTTQPPAAVVPCRAAGVEPAGPWQDGGFQDQQWLVRRGTGFVQVGSLLYGVVELADGTRTMGEIAAELTERTPWEVHPEDVALLIRSRLAPLALIEAPAFSAAPAPRASAGTPVRFSTRVRVLGPRAIDRPAALFQHLFRTPVLLPMLLVVTLGQVWLFAHGDPGTAIRTVAASPLGFPIVAGLLVAAAVCHEFGHAAALRFGGGRARAMGVGLYLVLPIFYTDVTDGYRLSRSARVRTDLGGFYFSLLAATCFVGIHAATGSPYPLVAALLVDLDVVRQLIPFIRLDGYWALADLTGIPDLFSHAGPLLRRRFGRGPRGSPPPLRPPVRRIFAAYLTAAVPAVAGMAVYAAWHAPTVVRTSSAAIDERAGLFENAIDAGRIATAILSAAEIVLLALPLAGFGFFAWTVARGAARSIAARRALGRSGADASTGSPPRIASAEARSRSSGDDVISLAAAIAEHLELKRRHAREALVERDPVSAADARAPAPVVPIWSGPARRAGAIHEKPGRSMCRNAVPRGSA